ncbi:MAG: amidohydrolase [Bdellovibrionales bacterium]
MALTRIERCYDSHVHLLGTGERQSLINLSALACAEDISLELKKPFQKRGEWILGRGWDQTKWPDQQMPHKKTLDVLFPDTPICFHRTDGHAVWVNSYALKLAGGEKTFASLLKDGALMDSQGELTGVLIDKAMNPILALLPEPTKEEAKRYLETGIQYFSRAGFTHIRELTCNQMQFDLLSDLEKEQKLKLAMELYFDANPYSPFFQALEIAKTCRDQKRKYLRVKGIKFFYDGALGSEGALLSCCYPGGHKGLKLMEKEELREVLRQTWANQLEPAIHVIGDEAAHEVTQVVFELSQKQKISVFHLEHAQILRPDTIEILKHLPVVLHFQPCQWHSDKRWLKEKLGSLLPYAFPIAAAEAAQITFYFGSDSPVEEASVQNNLTALEEMTSLGWSKMKSTFESHHTHPEPSWVTGCWSEFQGDRALKTYFENQLIYSRED